MDAPLVMSESDSAFDFQTWISTIINNVNYFSVRKTQSAEEYTSLLKSMLELVLWYETELLPLKKNLQRFDVDATIPANGYRSLYIIFERCFKECYTFCRELCAARRSLFFKASVNLKKLKSLVRILEAFKPVLNIALTMIESNNSSLPLLVNETMETENMIQEYLSLDHVAFHERYQGFYLCHSARIMTNTVSFLGAALGELQQKPGGLLSRILSAGSKAIKCLRDPELRSQQFVNVIQNCSTEFAETLWNISDHSFMKVLIKWVCPSLEVLEELWIPAEPVTIETADGLKSVQVQVPSSHIPPAPVRCVLMSCAHRKGQFLKKKSTCLPTSPPSPALLFHCHGGGYISQHPEGHEIYLRQWACDLNIPILSVDYTLALEAPFPRALEEIFLVYVWALNNAEKLGWTGERICFAGDSAGANFLMSIIIKCITLEIRKPDAILCTYASLTSHMNPSASRLICWFDTVLPFGFIIKCIYSYCGEKKIDGHQFTETNSPSHNKSSASETNKTHEQNSGQKSEDMEVVAIDFEGPEMASNQNETGTANYYYNFHPTKNGASSEQGLSYVHRSRRRTLYQLIQDISSDIKAKYDAAWHWPGRKVNQALQKNNWYRTNVLPFIPDIGLLPKIQEPFEVLQAQKIDEVKTVARNPYISPLLVSDEILKDMPKTYFAVSAFDPCLDDSITFAKKMIAVGKPVVVDVFDISHGFLNYVIFSKEARAASNVCVSRIKEALSL